MVSMPILVQWKWKEETKTFLVIFRFIDDFSKPNLRIKIYKSHCADMTWAPSHVELGLLSELLRYANIVNGLNESIKTKMRAELEVIFQDKNRLVVTPQSMIDIDRETRDENCIIHVGDIDEWDFWAPVCPAYIDYLKEVLKPYL